MIIARQNLNKWDILQQALYFMLLSVLQVFEFNFITFLLLGIGLAGSVILGIKSKQLNRLQGNADMYTGYKFNSQLDTPLIWIFIATSFGKGTGIASAFSTLIVIFVLGFAISNVYHRGYKNIAQTSHLYLSILALALWRILLLEPVVFAMILAFCGIVQGAVALYAMVKMKSFEQE